MINMAVVVPLNLAEYWGTHLVQWFECIMLSVDCSVVDVSIKMMVMHISYTNTDV